MIVIELYDQEDKLIPQKHKGEIVDRKVIHEHHGNWFPYKVQSILSHYDPIFYTGLKYAKIEHHRWDEKQSRWVITILGERHY